MGKPPPIVLGHAVTRSELEEYAAHYLGRLGDDEDAYFALIEAPHEIIAFLALAFRSEAGPQKRSMILNVIWQHRQPSAIPSLREGLWDTSPIVWKQALDGLVTIGGQESISTIEAANSRSFDCEADAREFRASLDEALLQLRGGFQVGKPTVA